MTVKQLIDSLKKVQDQSAEVVLNMNLQLFDKFEFDYLYSQNGCTPTLFIEGIEDYDDDKIYALAS